MVGIVKEEAIPVREFCVFVNGREMPVLEAPLVTKRMGENADDAELSEYLVRVEWLKDVEKSEAYWEKGLFASQHTVCRL